MPDNCKSLADVAINWRLSLVANVSQYTARISCSSLHGAWYLDVKEINLLWDFSTILVLLLAVLCYLQVESNYRAEVKVFKKFHANIIGKGGSTLKKVLYYWLLEGMHKVL